MIILGIDTSCDETSIGITDGVRVLANIVASQDDVHRDWGGVVPMLAKRAHEENLPRVLKAALSRGRVAWENIDAIAITVGPGLAPALEAGISFAKELAEKHQKALIPVNHMEGHILANLAVPRTKAISTFDEQKHLPAMALLVSGKHTDIVLMKKIGEYEIVGETVDDAIGESFDKIARLLGFGYPGGKVMAEFAKKGNPRAYDLPVAMRQSGDLNVSYSGIKTAIVRLVHELTNNESRFLTKTEIADIAASFERVAVKTFTNKVAKALLQHEVKSILIGGGVANNVVLRKEIRTLAKANQPKPIPVFVPYSKKLCGDNGTMMATAGFFQHKNSSPKNASLDRKPGWRLSNLRIK